MAITVTRETISLPVGKLYIYDIAGLANTGGTANLCTLAMDYTPTHAIVQCYGTVANAGSYDPATLTSSTINVYVSTTAAGATTCKLFIW